MQEKNIIQKIISFILNFIKIIFITILSFFKKLFIKNKKDVSKNNNTNNTTNNNSKKTNKYFNETTSMPDEPNNKTNEHDKESDNQNEDSSNEHNDFILELPKEKIKNITNEKKYKNQEEIYLMLDKIIDDELEKKYEKDNFKVKDAQKEVKEKIKDLKEKIIPVIAKKIINKELSTKEEIKTEVKKVIKKELEEKTLFSSPNKKSNQNYKEEIYFVAKPKQKDLNIKQSKPIKASLEDKLSTIKDRDKFKKSILNAPVIMVQSSENIPKPTLKDNIKEVALGTTLLTAGITRELLSNEEEKQKNENQNKIKTINEIPTIKKVEKEEHSEISELPKEKETINLQDRNEKTKNIKEIEEIEKEVKEKIESIKKEQKKKEKFKKDNEKKEQDPKPLIKDAEIIAIEETSESLISDSKKELKKEEFEEKDYDRIERQINKMLEDISNTYLRYEKNMSPKQKAKLLAEETKLRNAKDQIQIQLHQDIENEKKQLDEPITLDELFGLQEELKRMDLENKKIASEKLFKKMNSLEGLTKEQVANADKRVILKRFNKASLLLEMSSILALPFIRNKYFFHFTIGLIIDNHFNFVNAFFKRKINHYEPADLSSIKKGQDALDSALDITYKNIVELDYLEQQAIERYPELEYDPEFIKEVTNLRIKLNKNYNKLMKKNQLMEKYYYKTKKQIKILKPDSK